MSDQTFHTTTQDIRKPESKISQAHQGNTPKNSDVSAMKVSWEFRGDHVANLD